MVGGDLNLIDMLVVGLITTQIGMTIFYFRETEAGRRKIEELEAGLDRNRSAVVHLVKRFEETYILGRLLVEWIEVGREDNETLKSVVDELCLASKNKLVKSIYADTNLDHERRDRLYRAYKKIALCSEDPPYVLSALRYLSQVGGASELLLALRLYAVVDSDGVISFRPHTGWNDDEQSAFLGCVRPWAARLQISGRNLSFFMLFADPLGESRHRYL